MEHPDVHGFRNNAAPLVVDEVCGMVSRRGSLTAAPLPPLGGGMGSSSFPLPANETRRLQALRDYGILDTLPEQVYDDFLAVASAIFGCPVAQLSLVDEDRQWFKAKIGIEQDETPRDIAFCAHAIVKPEEVMVVRDATLDPRFRDNPLVTSDPSIRFYAGAPLVTPAGDAVGTVCVLDRQPRDVTPDQLEALRILSRQIVDHMELRRGVTELERMILDQDARMEALEEAQRVLKESELDLKAQSRTDPLTGVGNRRALEERLEAEFARAQRNPGGFSIAMVDLDHFKEYNDRFGHIEGDNALISVASLLVSDLRAQDFLARYGGEEFVIVLPGTSLRGAMVMGERFRRTIQRASWSNKPLTISVGVASTEDSKVTPGDLLRRADEALYRSKSAGRNHVSGPKAA
ncbi:MAG: sensor domain-containing diguanylate cyclase [Demequinaceae bacterium]|nr:sensor domain-containing diguanylate cyclase [Demequinaceae bacterium]